VPAWTLPGALMCAGAVHAFYTLGAGSVGVVMAMQLMSYLLLSSVGRAERATAHIDRLTAEREDSLRAGPRWPNAGDWQSRCTTTRCRRCWRRDRTPTR
jgi:hypothetical protein